MSVTKMNKKSMSAKELNTYSYKEVLEKSTAYFNGDDLAASTWANKYAMKNEKGEFIELTPDDMHKRMAEEFARIEAYYQVLTCPPSIRYKKKGLNINALYSFFVILTALKGQKCFILEL